MSDAEDKQDVSLTTPSAINKGRTSRCCQCNRRFGLVRRRLGLKQFCSARCLGQYKSDIERTTNRIKEWTDFLSRKL